MNKNGPLQVITINMAQRSFRKYQNMAHPQMKIRLFQQNRGNISIFSSL